MAFLLLDGSRLAGDHCFVDGTATAFDVPVGRDGCTGSNENKVTGPQLCNGHLDLLFLSLPTGTSRELCARVPAHVKIVDVGGDHRFVDGWTYGLTELPGARERIRATTRLANPGCYPAAALLALAPLLHAGLVEPEGLVIDAKGALHESAGFRAATDFEPTSRP